MTLILDPITTDEGHYFTLAEFRAWDTDFASVIDFPDLAIQKARAWAEERFETAAHCAWVERTATVKLVGTGDALLQLPHFDIRSLSAVSIDGDAVDVSSLVVFPYGLVKRVVWPLDSIIDVTYTYGQRTIPAPVKEAVMLLAGFKLVPNNLRSNATSESTDVGFIRIAHATPGGKTGLLEVDAVSDDYGHGKMVRVG